MKRENWGTPLILRRVYDQPLGRDLSLLQAASDVVLIENEC